ncbi:Glycine betaine aldehyde dehydrogenase [uncultured Mycobacterium sp.]|uniref:aldehyde dehydrogenase (NAD(+)) n=2 Tax=Mycobacteriaceae TaxID=1762 RepID=A0A064CC93_9MYCO|nr:aldehyde dehydrogenase family protein [Mycolicibacterium aromaticivorans]KDE97281.1 hypothetical protein Y900_028910 [Mycolicibacterium aromaticivorans JS19b1 = JCM 16368]SBS78805.1 Glycine betaine aldehyde dehydrogenase [uncultured Mycobacterium sp.]
MTGHQVIDPTTLDLLAEVRFSTPADIDSAARTAAAFLETSWASDSLTRSRALRSWSDEVKNHAAELADALVAQTGKTAREAQREVASCASTLEYYSGMARYVGGRAGTLSDGSEAHVVREPAGVAALIVPYNWPAALLIRDLAPALAAGATAVVKPAPQTSPVTLRLIEIGHTSGIPQEAVSVVVGDREVGENLVQHPQVRTVAFTGSTAVGRTIARLAADGLKRTLLELGGKGTSIVLPDADIPAALSASLAASVITAGQMCMACTRILVHSSCFERAVKYLEAEAGKLIVGDPREHGTQVGPLISANQLAKVGSYLEIARDEGKIVCGGTRIQPGGLPGHFVTPAIVTGLAPTSAVIQDDIFGPVLSVESYDEESEAVALANATAYGLATAVWTTSLDTAMRVGRKIAAGTVWINGYSKNTPELPSGGVKNSGLGRTRGIEGMEEFTVLKSIHFSLASP